jgi:ribosome maturation factor RimP
MKFFKKDSIALDKKNNSRYYKIKISKESRLSLVRLLSVSRNVVSLFEVAEYLLCCIRWSMKVSKFIVASR